MTIALPLGVPLMLYGMRGGEMAVHTATARLVWLVVGGKIVEGHTALDESMLTGEPMPVEKIVGAEVVAGTLNKTGSIMPIVVN